MGVSESDVTDIENGYHPDAKLAALLTFAARLTNTPSMVTETDINAARSVGATDQDIEDTIGVTALFAFMNRLVEGYGVKGDDAAFDLVGKSLLAGGYDTLPKMLGR